MQTLAELLDRLEELVAELERQDGPVREAVRELLDGIDALHRHAVGRLYAAEPAALERARDAEAAVAWLLGVYGCGVDEVAAAEEALASIRPYIHSHGGEVEVVAAAAGVVRVRLRGACAGCTASAVTLQHGVEEALREHVPGFRAIEVEEDEAEPHPPPGQTLLQIQPLSSRARPAR